MTMSDEEAELGHEGQIAELQQKLSEAEEELDSMKTELERTRGEMELADSAATDAAQEGEMQVMKVELDHLKQLEEVRRQFDRERERYPLELERANCTIAKLEKELSHRTSTQAEGGGSTTKGIELSSVKVNVNGEKSPPVSSSKRVTFVEPEGAGGHSTVEGAAQTPSALM